MAWHLRCALKPSPEKAIGWISSGWTDNQFMSVTTDKNNALALEYPLYSWHNEAYLRAPGTHQDWYGSDDSDSYARWVFWNSAKAVFWDTEGKSSTLSLAGARSKKLGKPDTDKAWLKWLPEGQTTLVLTWEEW